MNKSRSNSPDYYKYCPHCDIRLPKSTYYRHRRLYYDVESQRWSSTRGQIDDEQGEKRTEETWNPEDNDVNLPDEADIFDCGFPGKSSSKINNYVQLNTPISSLATLSIGLQEY